MTEHLVDCRFVNLLGGKHIPPKVSFIVWCTLQNSISTRSMLQSRGMNLPTNVCAMCRKELETANHLFSSLRVGIESVGLFLRRMEDQVGDTSFIRGSFAQLEDKKIQGKSIFSMVCFAICPNLASMEGKKRESSWRSGCV